MNISQAKKISDFPSDVDEAAQVAKPSDEMDSALLDFKSFTFPQENFYFSTIGLTSKTFQNAAQWDRKINCYFRHYRRPNWM